MELVCISFMITLAISIYHKYSVLHEFVLQKLDMFLM